ncbi:Beta strand repeat-containing protein, related [Eimeria brunetti]|uniref:Beta strand repeat-containing protein, related n=1 Tax=Eimeria brunetti TaxID=51314 RepID=U6LVA9_9EIME|nr:Beta strand repeat-containing protein, related [Eimeria brunetti]
MEPASGTSASRHASRLATPSSPDSGVHSLASQTGALTQNASTSAPPPAPRPAQLVEQNPLLGRVTIPELPLSSLPGLPVEATSAASRAQPGAVPPTLPPIIPLKASPTPPRIEGVSGSYPAIYPRTETATTSTLRTAPPLTLTPQPSIISTRTLPSTGPSVVYSLPAVQYGAQQTHLTGSPFIPLSKIYEAPLTPIPPTPITLTSAATGAHPHAAPSSLPPIIPLKAIPALPRTARPGGSNPAAGPKPDTAATFSPRTATPATLTTVPSIISSKALPCTGPTVVSINPTGNNGPQQTLQTGSTLPPLSKVYEVPPTPITSMPLAVDSAASLANPPAVPTTPSAIVPFQASPGAPRTMRGTGSYPAICPKPDILTTLTPRSGTSATLTTQPIIPSTVLPCTGPTAVSYTQTGDYGPTQTLQTGNSLPPLSKIYEVPPTPIPLASLPVSLPPSITQPHAISPTSLPIIPLNSIHAPPRTARAGGPYPAIRPKADISTTFTARTFTTPTLATQPSYKSSRWLPGTGPTVDYSTPIGHYGEQQTRQTRSTLFLPSKMYEIPPTPLPTTPRAVKSAPSLAQLHAFPPPPPLIIPVKASPDPLPTARGSGCCPEICGRPSKATTFTPQTATPATVISQPSFKSSRAVPWTRTTMVSPTPIGHYGPQQTLHTGSPFFPHSKVYEVSPTSIPAVPLVVDSAVPLAQPQAVPPTLPQIIPLQVAPAPHRTARAGGCCPAICPKPEAATAFTPSTAAAVTLTPYPSFVTSRMFPVTPSPNVYSTPVGHYISPQVDPTGGAKLPHTENRCPFSLQECNWPSNGGL